MSPGGQPYPPNFNPNLFQELLAEDRRKEAEAKAKAAQAVASDVVDETPGEKTSTTF